jgi:rRNA maturation endonuclease Nob1
VNSASNYRVQCWACSETVILPAQDGKQRCPKCGVTLQLVEWHGARGNLGRQTA